MIINIRCRLINQHIVYFKDFTFLVFKFDETQRQMIIF